MIEMALLSSFFGDGRQQLTTTKKLGESIRFTHSVILVTVVNSRQPTNNKMRVMAILTTFLASVVEG